MCMHTYIIKNKISLPLHGFYTRYSPLLIQSFDRDKKNSGEEKFCLISLRVFNLSSSFKGCLLQLPQFVHFNILTEPQRVIFNGRHFRLLPQSYNGHGNMAFRVLGIKKLLKFKFNYARLTLLNGSL